ncbi:MAG: carboxypeptidase-like regulatory domain-containing protein [Chitinophagaceae bacterium]|nr:carboxypeptidase-like regulatory domain-containing protein [Chitinophagaceae bacterium]
MKKLFILFLLFFSVSVNAQVLYKGFVYDSVSKATMRMVRVENITTHEGTYTNNVGYFEVDAKDGDYIEFSFVSYKNKVVKVSGADFSTYASIFLKSAPIKLKGVTIRKGPTQYQQDSARRASIYQDVLEYEQQKSVMSPVTTVYQKFSKKHRNTRKFKNQIVNMEFQNFIDSRYTKELVMTLTKLPEEEVQPFINAYPMEYQFARTASDLEIKMWIKYNFQEYLKRKK